MWYVLSKTLAEDAAWKFVKENNIDMDTINPAMVIGPLLQTLSLSSRVVLNLINGAQTFPNSTFGWVNVKDVANAHILALESPSASGRYILVERVAHQSELVRILHELYPMLQLPHKRADNKPYVPTYHVSKEKAPLEVGLKETVESWREKSAAIHGAERGQSPPLLQRRSQTRRNTHSIEAVGRRKKMSSGTGKLVCLTGASGYIASWLVKLLLHCGYTVKASVRDPNDPMKADHLLKFEGAKDRSHLFKANLLEEGSFDSLVEGCEGVFQTASPCYFDAKDPQVELIYPAVKGTLNVLKSCAKSPSVKRVVLTSSISAVAFNGKPRTPEVVIDETWFSYPDFCRESKFVTFVPICANIMIAVYIIFQCSSTLFLFPILCFQMWYTLSKTLAEEAAWEFIKQNNIDMVAVKPAMVIGRPLLQPTLNTTAGLVLNLIDAAQTFPNSTFGWVNVKDVANAHILAFEIPSASGRYLLVERVAHSSEIVRILYELYPTLQLPDNFIIFQCKYPVVLVDFAYFIMDFVNNFVRCANDKPYVPTFQVSKEKVKSLGIEFIPLEVSLKETMESF
ncbi:hypothetical protein L6164_017057 [Bauhinia variegata]|uniref:Uncharacterized protein n=1 Tax=Bauhinia variegata TaxID=167791 RepID=A0ACB9N6U4_BAUVA|nr:hypothetical protein L6164_017057 [Bauhinia variegata]